MSFFIQKLKISNFLSFFNEYEVRFEPLTGIICNYYEGRRDFFLCVEFVFGADLNDLNFENCLDLVHKIHRKEFLISDEEVIRSYVEIIIYFPDEEKELTFSRSIINWNGQARMQHKVGNIVTTKLQYDDKLNSLGLYINRKNLIFYKEHFDDVIWNSSENLEKIICTFLRNRYLAEDWKKSKEEVKYLTNLKNCEAEKNYNSLKTNHLLISKYTDTFENILSCKEKLNEKLVKRLSMISSDDSSGSTHHFEESMESKDFEEKNKLMEISDLEFKIEYLEGKLHNLKQKEAKLTSEIYHEEIKLAAKPVNAIIIQNRISEVKSKIREKEKTLSEIWEKINHTEKDIENNSNKISETMVSLRDIQNNIFLRDRFTKYGRFSDFLQPSQNQKLLKNIIGSDMFNAHLCESLDDGFETIDTIKAFERRETMIPFDCYSHKLKDIITASGEEGVEINTLEQLLIFLCKLRHYGLVDCVPGVIQKKTDFEEELPNGNFIFLQDNVYVNEDGLITYKYETVAFNTETESDFRKSLLQLQEYEEQKYQELKELFFQKYETLIDLNSLDNDLKYIQRKWRQRNPTAHTQAKALEITEIYKDYEEVFIQYFEENKNQELEDSEDLINDSPSLLRSSTASSDESLQSIIQSLEEVQQQQREIKEDLKKCNADLQSFYKGPFWDLKIRHKPVVLTQNLDKTKMFFEKEFKRLKKSLAQDDFEFFMSVQEWRKAAINSLIKNYDEIKERLNVSVKQYQNLASERKDKIDPLIQHLNNYLSTTLSLLLNKEYSVEVKWTPEEDNIQIKTFIQENGNLVEIQHVNTFLRFLMVFCVFLEIARFEKLPIIILDNMDDYFPLYNDDLSYVFAETVSDNQNPRFNFIKRIGQYLDHYLKMNVQDTNTTSKGGPIQVIFLAKGDMIHSASHFIWIKNQVLSEEYISEECNSYSEIHELKLDFIN